MRFLVATGHALWRSGLVSLLREHYGEGVDCVEADNFASAYRVLRGPVSLNVIVLDPDMPDSPGLCWVEGFLRASGGVPVVVLPKSDGSPREVWGPPGRVHLVKQATFEALAQTIAKATRKEAIPRERLHSQMQTAMANRKAGATHQGAALRSSEQPGKHPAHFDFPGEPGRAYKPAPPQAERSQTHSLLADLTEKQMNVLDGLIEGLSNKEIARREGVSDQAIKLRVRYVMQKLQVTNRTQAAMMGSKLRRGLQLGA